ncbi:MAG TPA: S1 family peptidase [Dokdonella sp.]|uniref:S1 family peptidase n=1 Tax=Dokdonella sp. TaxID=2291710 RepID=UPI002CBA3382|nr:S1 family peptidase [Dokdonella sp.]HUD43730.1 S1 family peptidase [Dokdonella sp.]
MHALTLAAALLAHPASAADQMPTIIGGELSERWPGVGALLHGERFGCTAFLVAPDMVMTAAHCIGSATIPPPDVFFTGPDLGHVLNRYPIASITPHPDYDPSTARYDLAMIRLATPASEPVVEVATTPLSEADGGRPVWMVGYGLDENDESQRKRIGSTVIGGVITDNVIIDALPQACYGDSGSPLLRIGADGQPVAIGVASYIDDAFCEGSTYYQRIDRALPFVLGFGNICVEDSRCSDALFASGFDD